MDKTRAKNLAGTFVNWWKNGRFTDENLHAKHCELIIEHKKTLTSEEADNRDLAKNMFADDFLKALDKQKETSKTDIFKDTIQSNISKKAIALSDMVQSNTTKTVDTQKKFNFEAFKHHYGKQYQTFMDKVIIDYKTTIESTGQTFDFNKYSKTIEQGVKVLCEKWWKKEVK